MKSEIKNNITKLLNGLLFISLILLFIFYLTLYHADIHNVDLAFNYERIRLGLGLPEEFQDKGVNLFGKVKVMNITDYYVASMHRLQMLYPAIFVFLGIGLSFLLTLLKN